MGSAPTPAHLLFLHHPFADDLIDRGLDECRGDPLSVSPPLAIGRNEASVVVDIRLELLDRVSGASVNLW
jgi:hypothetical protein